MWPWYKRLSGVSGRKASRKRQKVGYESSVPRCEVCTSFVEAGSPLDAQDPESVSTHHRCLTHGFTVKATGVCNGWECRYTGMHLATDAVAQRPLVAPAAGCCSTS